MAKRLTLKEHAQLAVRMRARQELYIMRLFSLGLIAVTSVLYETNNFKKNRRTTTRSYLCHPTKVPGRSVDAIHERLEELQANANAHIKF